MRCTAAVLLIAACASAPPPQPLPPNITVTVRSPGPISGAHVAFVDADATITDVLTDDAGRAQAAIEPGASVTAEYGHLYTILDVQPGDDLSIDIDPLFYPDTHALSVSFPPSAGAASYEVSVPCAFETGTTSPIAVSLSSRCGTHGPLLVLARPAADAAPTEYLEDADAHLDRAAYAVTSGWHAMEPLGVTVKGIDPATTAQLEVTALSPTTSTGTSTVPLGDPVATVTLPIASTANAHVLTYFSTGNSDQYLFAPVVPGILSLTVDLDQERLPAIAAATYDAATQRVTVTTDRGPVVGLVDVDLDFGDLRRWNVVGPSATFTLPPLPPTFAAAASPLGDAAGVDAAEVAVGDQPYDAVRPYASGLKWRILDTNDDIGAPIRIDRGPR